MAQDTFTLTDPASKALLALEPTFMWAAATMKDLPDMGPVEIAFAGRSNVGKSSLVNGLLNRNGLARASSEPGRTKELIFFSMKDKAGNEPMRIVDLPGYGYAKAAKTEIARWTSTTRDFLRGRSTLKRVFVLIDSRHGVKETDLEVMTGLDKAAVNYQVVLTKCDKLKAGEVEKAVAHSLEALKLRPAAHPEVLTVSSRNGDGLAELRAEIVTLVGLETTPAA
jgi:GTP-binding protein